MADLDPRGQDVVSRGCRVLVGSGEGFGEAVEMTDDYADFDVALERRGDGFVARVLDSPVGAVGPEDFVAPDASGLTALVGQMSAARRIRPAASDVDTATSRDSPKAFGTRLFDALFTGQIRFALRSSRHVAANHHRGLRLRLSFADAPELASLPWELLYDSERRQFPCRLPAYPTVRVVDVPDVIAPLALTGPIRMLVVVSSPRNLHPLDIEAEWARLDAALRPLTSERRLELVPLGDASLESLRVAVTRGVFHVFHFIGHGGVDPETGEGQLAFTSSGGLAQFEPSSHLGAVLANSPFELAVLNSCEGGRVTAVDPYGSTALTLVEHGIPAVVAMQFEISDAAATAFSGVLYDSVTAGDGIDLAVTRGRQAILTTSPSEWSTPVLYRRSAASTLFDVGHQRVATPEAPRVASASVKGTAVNLAWQQPHVAGVDVTHWEVSRNGVPHAVVYQPAFVDTPDGPGTYTYSVVARAQDQALSPPSADMTVRVRGRVHRWFLTARGRPRPLVWLFAAFMALSLAIAIVSAMNPVPAPTNVEIVATDPVTLVWDGDSLWSPVYEWEVVKDGTRVGTTRSPRWQDPEPPKGVHRYTIRAVDSSGRRSVATTITLNPSPTTSP